MTRLMNFFWIAAILCLQYASAAAQAGGVAISPAAADSTRIIPLADHHQHLTSPRDAIALAPPPQPEIKLPAALSALLEKRSELWESPEQMRALFTDSAVVLDTRFPKWVTGPERSAYTLGWMAFPPYRPYVLRPVAYRERGNTARIHGLYIEAEVKDRILGYFNMEVEKGADGRWRIAAETPSFPRRFSPSEANPVSADDLIALLDTAGIRRAVIYSNANHFDGLITAPGEEYANVRAENDWTAEQVMRYPDRLVALCSFTPWRDHAVAELERCSRNRAFRGVKLHFGNSAVDFDNPAQLAKVRRVFEAANRLRMPLVVHLAATPKWGARQAAIFLSQLVTAAPDVQVVVNHLWGGAFYKEETLAFFANVISSGTPAAKNLYFEVAQLPLTRGDKTTYEGIVRYMRQIGFDRLYYGSDSPNPPGLPPKEMWEQWRKEVPLTEREFRLLANNVAPWAR